LVVIVAAIGFLFDIYELLMLPLIIGPALAELLRVAPDHPLVNNWVGFIFWFTAVCGGIFGLLGGWLTDRFGRKTVLVGSILVYSLSPVAAAFSTDPWTFTLFRCTTFIGVCVEFVAAISWLAELFPDPKRRETMLGATQAFSSLGGLAVTGAAYLCRVYAQDLPALPVPEPFDAHASWRYTLITGLLPALPILFLLPFVPESPAWLAKKRAGTLKRPSIAELFSPALRRTTIVSTLLFACAYGAAFGALQLTPTRIVPGLPELREEAKALAPLRKAAAGLNKQYDQTQPGSPERQALEEQLTANRKEQKPHTDHIKEYGERAQFWQEMGGLAGRIALAFLALAIVSRQWLLRLFQVPGLFVMPLIYLYAFPSGSEALQVCLALGGFLTVAQFSFWGNYLPRVFPLHLRGTGESFAANVGGRMIGTSAALLTTNIIAPLMPGDNPAIVTPQQIAYAAALVGLSVYVIGVAVSFWLPEPKEGAEE
jgi:MFS family permease